MSKAGIYNMDLLYIIISFFLLQSLRGPLQSFLLLLLLTLFNVEINIIAIIQKIAN